MKSSSLRSKIAGMIESVDEIISGVNDESRDLKKLIEFRTELKSLVDQIDTGSKIDRHIIVPFMIRFVEFLCDFGSK